MKDIGGYFQLECGRNTFFHEKGICLNSGRNALRCIIRALGITKIYVPVYTCPSVQEVIRLEHCEIIPYVLNEKFLPRADFPRDAFVLYNNYFGCLGQNVKWMVENYPNLIVDNAQAFFSSQIGRMAFYSPRKFFGLPDGGIILGRETDDRTRLMEIVSTLPVDYSGNRLSHLIRRIEEGAEAGYSDYKENTCRLSNSPVAKMSQLTRCLMGNCDPVYSRKRRMMNFNFLKERLPTVFPLALSQDDVPLVYPYVCFKDDVRSRLIDQKIFVPLYWPTVESGLSGLAPANILPLPIDQRYGTNDMETICEALNC